MTPTPASADRVATAASWLAFYSACDSECLETHPIAHSTVTGLHAVAATARIELADEKQQHDETIAVALLRLKEMQSRIDSAVAQLQALADRSPVPPAGALLSVVNQLKARP